MKRTHDQISSEGAKPEVDLRKHDEIVSRSYSIFSGFPTKTSIKDRRTSTMVFQTADVNATSFTSVKFGDGVGLMETSKARISAQIRIRLSNGNAQLANDCAVPVERPLTAVWREKLIKLNDYPLSTTNPNAQYATYFEILTKESLHQCTDDPEIRLAYPNNPDFPTWVGSDVAGAVGLSHTGNLAARIGVADKYVLGDGALANNGDNKLLDANNFLNVLKRGELIRNDWRYCKDVFYMPCVRESKNTFLPSSLKVEIGLEKMPERAIMQYGNTDGPLVLQIKDLQIEMPLLKPNDQMLNAINQLLAGGQTAKYFTTNYQVITYPIAVSGQDGEVNTVDQHDVFTGKVPSRMFVAFIDASDYNGSNSYSTPYNFRNMRVNQCAVHVSNRPVPDDLRRDEDIWFQLREVLGCSDREMPFSYDRFLKDRYIIGYDLSNDGEPNTRSLSTQVAGQVHLNLQFTRDATAAYGADPANLNGNGNAGYIVVFGEFRDQYGIPMVGPPQSLYTA